MIELRPLTELDATEVVQNQTEVVQRVQEDNPRIDVRRGVFAELLAYYHAILDTQRQANIQDYWAARSLKAIEEDPTLADPDLVDDILSNFLVTRQEGSQATGEVTIVVSAKVPVSIGLGAAFQANGKVYLTPIPYTAKLDAAQVVSEGDRLLSKTPGGNWAFTIGVIAQEEGAESIVKKDTLVIPNVPPPNYVTSYAAGDFINGTQAETNQEMLDRLQAGIAAPTLSSRGTMQAALRDVEEFSRVVHTSVVGFGDSEMTRDRHWIFPVSGGGRCDWYVRTQERLLRTALTKTATLVEIQDDTTSVWEVLITRDDAPGFYEFRNIRVADDEDVSEGGFTITSDIRDINLDGDGFRPDLANEIEAAYSRYATATLRFIDTETDTTAAVLGDKADYSIEAVGQPLIAEIQDHVASHAIRHYGADCVVKAAVPAFLQLNLTIYKRAGEDDPDLEAIRDDLCTEVNTIGFVGRLYASQLQDIIHNHLINDQTVSSVDMFARVLYPSQTVRYLRDEEKLEVPDDPEDFVSEKTVQFFVDPADIGITIITNVPTTH